MLCLLAPPLDPRRPRSLASLFILLRLSVMSVYAAYIMRLSPSFTHRETRESSLSLSAGFYRRTDPRKCSMFRRRYLSNFTKICPSPKHHSEEFHFRGSILRSHSVHLSPQCACSVLRLLDALPGEADYISLPSNLLISCIALCSGRGRPTLNP